MSRTIRRNKPHLLAQTTLPIYRYTRDWHSGKYGVPRWYRHLRYNDRMRRAERDEILRCLQRNEWDDHLTGHHRRGARHQWHW